jgi:hypothetical protein
MASRANGCNTSVLADAGAAYSPGRDPGAALPKRPARCHAEDVLRACARYARVRDKDEHC